MNIAAQTINLRKTYGSIVAVNNLNLSVPAGSVFGLLGPNGAGKSTTFGILAGWLNPTSGTSYVLNTPSQELSKLGGQIAALPQDAAFPPQISVKQELTHFGRLMGLSKSDAWKETERVLEAVSLQNAATQRGSELSHGMAKRIGIAQTLIGAPKVIFLDEPTAGLDPASARQIKDLIATLTPQTTVVISSHNLSDIEEICTHGAILERGNMTISGTIGELTRQSNEISIEVQSNREIPQGELESEFGLGSVSTSPTQNDTLTLTISFSNEREVTDAIGRALKILLDANIGILGVQRGTSLESAFIELTTTESG